MLKLTKTSKDEGDCILYNLENITADQLAVLKPAINNLYKRMIDQKKI